MQGKHWHIVVVVIIIFFSLSLISVPPGGFWGWTGLNGKTAWDLAELLIVPLALAIVVFVFNRRQKQFELGVAEEQRNTDREIAERERENERQIATA